ncbi:hypothetical protein MKEN_01080300 [Mycena kentingensis (nom. inval.)]|nr:hypothetical protein MKEN_01080300 [Mycena kentingensis (nom. inval.)]
MSGEPALQRGLLRLPAGSERVLDADEEVFILYSRSTTEPRGLGYVDNRSDILTLSFTLKPGFITKGKRKQLAAQEKTVEIQMAQDKTALRSRSGDTGSVVWQASIDFAQSILQQHHAKSPDALFDLERLPSSRILELGSGTGLLSIALSPLVAHFTATDIPELLPLMRKNLALNFPAERNVSVNELNWQTLASLPPARRAQLFTVSPDAPYDIVLIVDCIYHPSLLPSLLATIDYVATTPTTAVVVAMELRAEDVTREFLEGWLALDSGRWEVWRVANDSDNGILAHDKPYVVWVGWKGQAPTLD